MEMINEFIAIRLKVFEICNIFHEAMPEGYEFLDLKDISISLEDGLEYISVRNNCDFYNTEYLCFSVEWLNKPHLEIKKIVKTLKRLTKPN